MTRRIAWILLSCLIVTALVLTSCGPSAEEEVVTPTVEEEAPVVTPETPITPTVEGEEEVVTPIGSEMVYDSQGKLVEAPQYGGTLYVSWAPNTDAITPARKAAPCLAKEPVYEWMQQADWAKGPAGTGEHPYNAAPIGAKFLTGAIAESWKLSDEYTMVYHIREGVHFQNKAPAWGREYTGEDFVRNANWRFNTPWSYLYINPSTPEEDRTRVELIDDMTVKITYTYTDPTRPLTYDWSWQAAPETLEHEPAEGELPWENDWRYMCGTGPFILKDYVEDSAWEYVRSDNYWMHDPMHPDNQLPYIDRIVGLVIPDIAVYQSALQTGKLDVGDLSWEKAETFKKEVPDMLWSTGAPRVAVIFFQVQNEPFNDVRVRRALSLAFNNQKMLEEYYGGNAVLNNWPAQPTSEGFVAVEDMPEDLQEYYIWKPENNEKAKQLLADAGYPNGLQLQTHVAGTRSEERMLIIADDWAKIGVNLKVDMIDGATWSGMLWNKTSPHMILCDCGNSAPDSAIRAFHGGLYPPHLASFGNVIDPVAEEAFRKWQSMWSQEDAEERAAFLKQEYLRETGLCWDVPLPVPYLLKFWWPWVKGFYGTFSLGFNVAVGASLPYKYVWVDRDLKHEMTGSRE